MRVGEIAAASEPTTLTVHGSGGSKGLRLETQLAGWTLALDARQSLSLRLEPLGEQVRLQLRAEARAVFGLRTARGKNSGPAARTSPEATLVVEWRVPESWTLTRTLARTARWLAPASWLRARRLPPAGVWEMQTLWPTRSSIAARVENLRILSPEAFPALTSPTGEVRLEAGTRRLDRRRLRLATGPRGELLLNFSHLDRSGWALDAGLGLSAKLVGAQRLGAALERAVDLPAPLAREIAANARRAARLREAIATLPRAVRRVSRRALDADASLPRLIRRLRRLEQAVALAGLDGEALERVRSVRRQAEALAARIAAQSEALATQLEARSERLPLARLERRLNRWLEAYDRARTRLLEQARHALAQGAAAQLALDAAREQERSVLLEAAIDPGARIGREIFARLIDGQPETFAELKGSPGLQRLSGSWERAERRERRVDLRLRLLGLEGGWTRRRLAQRRIVAGVDGAVEISEQRRRERAGRSLLTGRLATTVIEAGWLRRDGDQRVQMLLSWEESWRGRRSLRRRLARQQAISRWLQLPPPPPPDSLPERGRLRVISRLDQAAVGRIIERAKAAVFWPTWVRAVAFGYRLAPSPRLGADNHPLLDAEVRRALGRDPSPRALASWRPTLSEAEARITVAYFLVGKGLLAALGDLRRIAATSPTQAVVAAAERIPAAVGRIAGVQQVALLLFAGLAPAATREITVEWLTTPPGASRRRATSRR